MKRALLGASLALAAMLVATPASADHREITQRFEGAETSFAAEIAGGGVGGFIQSYKLTQDGGTSDYTSVTLFYNDAETSMECVLQQAPSTLVVDPALAWATVDGNLSGTCFDFSTEQDVPFSMSLDLSYLGVGRARHRSGTFDVDGVTCGRDALERPAVTTGTINVVIPDKNVDVTSSPTVDPSFDFITRGHEWCVAPGPAA